MDLEFISRAMAGKEVKERKGFSSGEKFEHWIDFSVRSSVFV